MNASLPSASAPISRSITNAGRRVAPPRSPRCGVNASRTGASRRERRAGHAAARSARACRRSRRRAPPPRRGPCPAAARRSSPTMRARLEDALRARADGDAAVALRPARRTTCGSCRPGGPRGAGSGRGPPRRERPRASSTSPWRSRRCRRRCRRGSRGPPCSTLPTSPCIAMSASSSPPPRRASGASGSIAASTSSDRVERLEVELDGVGAVLGRGLAVGEHERHRLADEHHLARRAARPAARAAMDRQVGERQHVRARPGWRARRPCRSPTMRAWANGLSTGPRVQQPGRAGGRPRTAREPVTLGRASMRARRTPTPVPRSGWSIVAIASSSPVRDGRARSQRDDGELAPVVGDV